MFRLEVKGVRQLNAFDPKRDAVQVGGDDNTSKDISRSTIKIGMWMMFMYKVGKCPVVMLRKFLFFRKSTLNLVLKELDVWDLASYGSKERESSNTKTNGIKALIIVDKIVNKI